MKRTAVCLLIATLCLGVAGCAALPTPEKAADGAAWSEGWVTVGGVVGVDTPDGMASSENNEALAANGMYYATWSIGEGEPYTNEDGEEATLYDAQVYLLLGGCKSGEEAQDTMAQWQEMAQAQYTVGETAEAVHNGQEFSLITYTFDGETNPYARGTSAFGVYRNYAISVEFTCREGFDGDAEELLLLQPPLEVLPAPAGMVVETALGDLDVLIRFADHNHHVAAAAVVIADQITRADLIPAWVVHPPPREVSKRGIATQRSPAGAVGSPVVGPAASGAIGRGVHCPGGIGFPELRQGGPHTFLSNGSYGLHLVLVRLLARSPYAGILAVLPPGSMFSGGGYSVFGFRLNTGFKSAMIVTERFSQFNSPEPCRVWNLISIGYGRDAPMYAITNDYFDSFSAIFGPRECLLNGKWYPLGHFAVEALEMDRSLLWKLKAAVAEFKPELEVFLAARTASSAAVAQQKLDAVWAILDQIPVYKNLRGSFSGSQGLFHSMRGHPDRTDDSVTEGTNFHRAMTYWLDRLERLPDAVDDFIGNTSLMLGDYFENLPARSPAAYAEAYDKYRRTMDAAFQYAEEEDEVDEDLDSIQLDFPVRLGFRAMKAKDGGAVFGEELTFNELASFLYTDLYKGMAAGNAPRRCHNCKHFFLTVGGHDTVYCNRVAPDETKRTCRQVGAHRKEKRKNQAPILKEYSRAYNRLKSRKSRGSISTDKWNRQVAVIQDWRDAALKGELSDAEFKQRLDGV